MTTIRWGILGTGWVADMMTADLLANGFTVAAVGSRTADAAAGFAARHGIASAHASYQALVEDPAVDAVYVATPHPMHASNALSALDAGKHVLVEKPFTINAAEADAVARRAADRGLVAMEAMWTRWLPHMARIRQRVADGVLGELRTIIADHGQRLPGDPAHRLQDPALGGGALLDLGVYPVSFAWDLLGEPETIAAHAARTATGVDRQTAVILGYGDGRQAVLHCALDCQGPNAAVVIGTEGRIEIDPVWYAPTSFTRYDADGAVVERFDGAVASRGMQYQAAEFERRIREGTPAGAVLPLEETVAVMRTLDAIRARIGLAYPGEPAEAAQSAS